MHEPRVAKMRLARPEPPHRLAAVLIEPVHLFVPKGRSALRVTSRSCSPATFLVRYWAKHAPNKIAKIWSSPAVEQRPATGETLSDEFLLDGMDNYWLAILVFHYTGEYWSRAPLMSESTDAVPARGLAFADCLGTPEAPAACGAGVLVDVEYV